MKMYPHPGFEVLFNLSADQHKLHEQLSKYRDFAAPDSLEIYDTSVPGLDDEPEVKIRIYKKKGIKKAPVLLNIHGGGFVSGDLDNDNYRCSGFAENVGCTVVSVEYRLAPQHPFPAALNDIRAVLMHVYENPEEFDIDNSRIAVFGTSAGGNMAAGLCLYLRDHNDPKISFQILNFPALSGIPTRNSAKMMYEGTPMVKGEGLSGVLQLYLGGYNGTRPSYYAMPSLAPDLSGLPPAFIITCEYDPLRDEGIEYASRLLEFAVPTELHSMPRVPHGYDLIGDEPLTKWIREGMYLSLKREFGIK